MSEQFVKIQDVHFARGSRVIYSRLNMQFPKGKITAILGPSGCGKTTLLKLIGGQVLPQKGDVIVGDESIPSLSRAALHEARQKMGMLFQSGALFTNLSAFENVAFPLREHTMLPEEVIHDLVLMKLEAVGLRGARHLKPHELSGGMGRRVALARAIALDPRLIMYDEPFAGLDPISLGVIVKLIRELNQTLKMTSIIVSHDVKETLSIADYVYIIAEGQVIGEGTPEVLLINSSPQIEQFIKGLPDGVVPFHFPAADYSKELLEGDPNAH